MSDGCTHGCHHIHEIVVIHESGITDYMPSPKYVKILRRSSKTPGFLRKFNVTLVTLAPSDLPWPPWFLLCCVAFTGSVRRYTSEDIATFEEALRSAQDKAQESLNEARASTRLEV